MVGAYLVVGRQARRRLAQGHAGVAHFPVKVPYGESATRPGHSTRLAQKFRGFGLTTPSWESHWIYANALIPVPAPRIPPPPANPIALWDNFASHTEVMGHKHSVAPGRCGQ